MSDRARGVVLYAGAAVLLGSGVFWWLGAAPGDQRDPVIEEWRASALRLLPDVEDQIDADTLALGSGAQHEVVSEVETGEFVVSVVCVGGADSQVRVSLGDSDDSGHGLRCSGDITPETFRVSLAGQLQMNVSVTEASPVVFRYSLLRGG